MLKNVCKSDELSKGAEQLLHWYIVTDSWHQSTDAQTGAVNPYLVLFVKYATDI